MKSEISLNPIALEELQGGNNLLQTPFWAQFKARQGWSPQAFRFQWRSHRAEVLVLVRKILKFLPIAYVPFGPELPQEDREIFLKDLSWELISYLPMGTLFIRYDLQDGWQEDALLARKATSEMDSPSLGLERPLRKALLSVQPPDTVVLSLKEEPQDILGGMHKKWRYNIRLAEKKGVEIRLSQDNDLTKWYQLYQETAQRDRIALHSKAYYQSIFSLSKESPANPKDAPRFQLFEAYHEGDLLAGIIVNLCGHRATYLYGASSNEKRNLMPAYLLQWKAMEWARQNGAEEYDFFGIPPTSEEGHAMHGLFLFKTGFGGKIHHYLGAWDYPYSKVFYHLYRLLERFRVWYYRVFKKK